jgi:hypothetical protein
LCDGVAVVRGSRISRSTEDELVAVLSERRKGLRTAVPVLGAGVNIQAAAIEGLEDQDDWRLLIEKIAGHIDLPKRELARLPLSHLAKWEILLRRWARSKGQEPFKAEQTLQKFVCEDLREQEARCRSFKLYSEFIEAQFHDIISLNFDRRLALSSDREQFDVGPERCPEGSHGEPLYRHSLVPHEGGGETRVWYPHGDTKKTSTLKLGVRKYGFYVVTLRESLGETGTYWRYKPSWESSLEYRRPGRRSAVTWVDVFLSRALVFIGCGLSRDEWPMWSLLKDRHHLCPGQVALFVTAGPETDDERNFLRLNPLPELRIVRFASYTKLWSRIRETLADR